MKAFATQLEEKRPILKKAALKFTRNLTDAEDLVSLTIYKALKNENKFIKGTNLSGWLYTILKNSFYSSRTQKSIIDYTDDSYQLSKLVSFNDGVHNMDYKEIQKIIRNSLSKYKDLYIIFNMLVDGYKYEEISKELNKPLGTVKNSIHRLRQILIKELSYTRN